MHLTLTFIGEADIEPVAQSLLTMKFPSFELTLQGVGQFPSKGSAVTIWAGIKESSRLRALQETIATALLDRGFPKENRPYNPHLTLARYDPGVSVKEVEEFCRTHASFVLPDVSVTAFFLYSSAFVDGVPRYRRERPFALDGP